MSSKFDWSADEAIVLHAQPPTAIYTNPHGQVVIRQERPLDQDEDVFVVIDQAHLQTIIDALVEMRQ